jgi:hypothetical protein
MLTVVQYQEELTRTNCLNDSLSQRLPSQRAYAQDRSDRVWNQMRVGQCFQSHNPYPIRVVGQALARYA